MKLQFKQGLVRVQTDTNNNLTFLQLNGSGVTVNVSPDTTLLTFSHGDADYLFEEQNTVTNAWPQPFQPVDQWLYWDIDITSGERTFGITTIKPVISINQPAGVLDRHWFDLQSKKMKVFTGQRYVIKLRVFAAVLTGGTILTPYSVGTQVGLNTSIYAGMILFDEDNKPVKKFDRRGNGEFITTETPLTSQFSRLINFKLENELKDSKANEFIPKHYCVTFKNSNSISLAKNTDPDYPCTGITSEDMNIGENRTFISNGYVKNDSWNWSENPGTPIFVGDTGQIITAPPQSVSIQNIGHIVSPKEIFINIKQIIKLL